MAYGKAWQAKSLDVPCKPAIIAHGGGNSLRRAREAVTAGADLVEADIWSYRRRLETRHERRVPLMPVLFERWYLRWAPGRHVALPELLDEVHGKAGILLDFKNRRYAPALVREAVSAVVGEPHICASSQFWPILRLVHEVNPEMDMFYSIDVKPQLDLFWSVVDRDARPAGVSCNHRHLTAATVERFHSLGLAIIAWTVDDPARAEELARLEVDAITTNDVPAISRALGRG